MSEQTPGSVGLVTPSKLHCPEPLTLASGRTLAGYDLVYETYGTLNANASNALLVCHALSGDHHAAGYHSAADAKPGWWDHYIGPGKPIDTERFFVVSLNNLGGCGGSTGPRSINPETGRTWGPDFPIITVPDWVKSQALLADHLGIRRWACVAGGSLGGMQALQWAIDLPHRVASALVIAAAPRLSAQNIAFNEVARKSIQSDPDFHGGHYYDKGVTPRRGLMLARMLGHITYLSDDLLRAKFGRELREGKLNFGYDVEFQVESYLRHQGETFVDRFDANTYLLMTKALDYFDPAAPWNGDLSAALSLDRLSDNGADSLAPTRFLVVSFSSDWRFAPGRSLEIVKAMHDARRRVAYLQIESPFGHDAFLLPNDHYARSLGSYLRGVHAEVTG